MGSTLAGRGKGGGTGCASGSLHSAGGHVLGTAFPGPDGREGRKSQPGCTQGSRQHLPFLTLGGFSFVLRLLICG